MTDMANTAPLSARRFGTGYQVMLLILIMLVSAFAYVDRTVVQTLGQSIKEDLNLSDLQLGLLGGLSFAVFYSTLGLPLARLAETKSRVTIISVSVALFSLFSGLCGIASGFGMLFLFRVGVGIGEAGVSAPGTSLIGDHFAPHRRGMALTLMRLGAPAGSAFGTFVGAWIGMHYGWRAAIVSVSVPGLIVALLFRLLLREPPRGMMDPIDQRRAAAKPPPMGLAFRTLFADRAYRHLLFGLSVTSMGLYSAGSFAVPFYMRVHGLSLQTAGAYLGSISTISSLIGMSLSGFGVDLIAKRGMRWYALVPCIGLVVTTPLYFYAYASAPPFVAMMCMLVGGTFMFFHAVPTLVAMQNMVAVNMRATAAFLYFFVSTLVGVGIGPVIIGKLSDIYASSMLGGAFAVHCGKPPLSGVCAAASAYGIRMALVTSCLFFVWGAIHYWLAARAIGKDRI
jgi:predicted MFS family arabinose efflux permease